MNNYQEGILYPKSELESISAWWQEHREYDINEYEDHVEIVKRDPLLDIPYHIQELKQKLLDSDYKAIKYAEGYLTDEEYEPIKAQRQAWRDEINSLQNKLGETV